MFKYFRRIELRVLDPAKSGLKTMTGQTLNVTVTTVGLRAERRRFIRALRLAFCRAERGAVRHPHA